MYPQTFEDLPSIRRWLQSRRATYRVLLRRDLPAIPDAPPTNPHRRLLLAEKSRRLLRQCRIGERDCLLAFAAHHIRREEYDVVGDLLGLLMTAREAPDQREETEHLMHQIAGMLFGLSTADLDYIAQVERHSLPITSEWVRR